MKLSILLQRIAAKVHAPRLPYMATGREPWTTECLIWTGSTSIRGPHLQKHRDRAGRPYMYVTQVLPYGRIAGNYVHRVLYALANPEATDFKLRSLCRVTLCVNPLHWAPIEAEPEADIPYEPDAPWTFDEAENAVKQYLVSGDPEYLSDIPPDLILQVFAPLPT